MSFNIRFDTITHQFSVDVDGIKLKYAFDGKTLTIDGKVLNPTANVTSTSMSSLTSNANVNPNIPAPITHIGVTSYIKSIIPRMSNPTVIDSKPISSTMIIPTDEFTSRMVAGMKLMSALHFKVNPALDGVCIEGLLYIALKRKLYIDSTITEPFNFNTIFNTDLIATHKDDSKFKSIFDSIDNAYAYADYEFKGFGNITYSKLDVSKFGDRIADFILYVAMYAYINIEKRGFPNDNYTPTQIVEYCSMLIANREDFEGLFEYISAIADKLTTPTSEVNVIKFVPDVPIKEFVTKNYCLNGNVDLLAITDDNGNKPSAWIYDCKCCRKDDNYVDTDWPQQLNLYAKGLKDMYDIKGLCIVNIFTNWMFRYDVIKGLDSVELD